MWHVNKIEVNDSGNQPVESGTPSDKLNSVYVTMRIHPDEEKTIHFICFSRICEFEMWGEMRSFIFALRWAVFEIWPGFYLVPAKSTSLLCDLLQNLNARAKANKKSSSFFFCI